VIAATDNSRRAIRRGALAFLIYCGFSGLIFGRGFASGLASTYLGTDTDPYAFFWFIAWWPYAIAHRLNPLFTSLLWAPRGTSLAWATPIPLPSILIAPFEHFAGPVAAYNVLCLAAPIAAAFSAYLLCRWITHKFWPSILGGLIFGFSPYMLGQMLGHVDLVMVFPVPLATLVVLKRFDGELRDRGYAIALAAILVAQFLCFPEIFATMTVFGAVAFAIAILIWPERSRVAALIVPTIVAYALALAILSPYLYAMLRAGAPSGPIYPLNMYSADLLNLIVPERTAWLGAFTPLRAVSRHFAGFWIEHGACFGIPLLIIAEAYRKRNWQSPACRIAILALAAIIVASFGPVLMVGGVPILPMPWALATHVPLIGNALPVRFAMYGFLMLAIIAALWFSFSDAGVIVKTVAASAILLMMLPRLDAGFWTSPVKVPVLFTGGAWRACISPGSIILPLPYERNGTSMLWQASADLQFRMASGYTSIVPPGFKRFPAVKFFLGAIDLPEAGEQVKAFVALHDIGAIAIDDADPDLAAWHRAIDPMGLGAIESGGVRLYQVPAGTFAPYAQLSASDLEARAVALRCDILIEALARWFRQGGTVAAVSPAALQAAGLLPPDWIIKPGFFEYRDFTLAPLKSNRVAIILAGSYGALRPIARRYQSRAAKIYAAYPELWRPDAKYPGDTPMRFLFEFDPAAIEAAAADLKSAPPPERTARFWPAPANPGDARREPSR